MGIKKLQNLFKPTGPKKQSFSAVRTTNDSPAKNGGKDQAIRDKAEIESYIKSIKSKIEQGEGAKKAADILSEWINKK
ncbi:hypothetical protein [Halobacteriovorax sp. HLS]|uniref:hypothetical protein n=1 Tax=Halobacteriovorax sp. HLS TaxID=2234000 RepID=UPI000FDADD7D|nr:hypothetical protein [Halobacteriovorax sp. HLS]